MTIHGIYKRTYIQNQLYLHGVLIIIFYFNTIVNMSFNWEIYKELNPDLLKAGIKTKEQVENHYRVHGIGEKRKIHINQMYPGFNPTIYKNNYGDLSSLTLEQASLHWLKFGRYEKRSYKNIINRPNSLISENDIRNFFKGKRVAIIAPSPSVRFNANGDEIDKYDIVVRINKNWKHNADLNKYVGTRTDVLYNCINPDPDCGGVLDFNYIKTKVKYIAVSIPIINDNTHRDSIFHNNRMLHYYNDFFAGNNNRVKHYIVNKNLYNKYDKILNSRPNTGFMAILDILSYDIKELYVKGFTFFKDGYLKDYRNNIFGVETKTEQESAKAVNNILNVTRVHNVDRQIELFKNIYRLNKNIIKIDETMKKILNILD
jgi:hypothetical protein